MAFFKPTYKRKWRNQDSWYVIYHYGLEITWEVVGVAKNNEEEAAMIKKHSDFLKNGGEA